MFLNTCPYQYSTTRVLIPSIYIQFFHHFSRRKKNGWHGIEFGLCCHYHVWNYDTYQ